MALFLYDLLYCIPTALLTVIYVAKYTAFFEPTVLIFLAAVLFSVLFAGLVRMKWWLRMIILLVLPLQIFLFLLFFKEKGERIPYLVSQIHYLWIFLLTLLAFILVKVMTRFPAAKIGTAVLFFGLLVLSMIRREETRAFTVALTMLFLLFAAAEGVRMIRMDLRQSDAETRKYLVFLSPFLLLVFVVLLIFKAPEKAYDWDFAKRIYADVATAVDHIQISLFQGSSGSYENATVGFSDDALLSGNVKAKTRDVMVISSNVRQKYQLYLGGKCFNDFDGRTWESGSSSEMNETTLDVLESYGSVLRYDPEYVDDYLKPRSVKIGYRYFNSRHMFHPLKAVIIPELVEEFECEFDSGNVIADHKISYEDDYNVTFFRMNRKPSLISGLLADTRPLSPEEWDAAGESLNIDGLNGLSYADYEEYRKIIYRDYTEAPVLTERTGEFMRKLMEGAETDFEKMNRLEAFLQSFDYDTAPGSVPDRIQSSGEYLDYFLFENPKGYCNYFATAMVLLARAEGRPARYMQGYLTTLVKDKQTVVKSDRAHSWAEIYFDGFGWIAYEATPGFHIDSTWTIASEKEGQGTGSGGGTAEIHMEDLIVIPEDLISDPGAEPVMNETDRGTLSGLSSALIVIASGILAVILLLFIVILIRNVIYRRMDNGKKLKLMFRRNMSLLQANGLSLDPGETLTEFRERVSAYIFSEDMKKRLKGSAAENTVSDVLTFLSDYELAVFADAPVTERTVRNSEASNRKLLAVTGRVRGLFTPLIYARSVFR